MQGYNIARVVGDLAGMGHVPGVTVNRYCSSSLQTIRMAAHAIKAGEGDVFVAAGVETVSQFGSGMADGLPGTHNERMAAAEARTAERAQGGAPTWTPFDGGVSDSTSPWARPPRTWPSTPTSPARTRTSSPPSRSSGPPPPRSGASSSGRSPRSRPSTPTAPRHVTRDDGIRAGTTKEKLAELKPVFRPDGTVTAGNACPLNDGAAAVIVMSDTRARELGITPLGRVISSGVSAPSTPRSWASARSRPSARRCAGPA